MILCVFVVCLVCFLCVCFVCFDLGLFCLEHSNQNEIKSEIKKKSNTHNFHNKYKVVGGNRWWESLMATVGGSHDRSGWWE